MDIQTILVFILALLTLNLVAVGIYVMVILKEFRETIKKANKVLDNVGDVTDAVSHPVSSIANIVNGVVQSVTAVKAISSLFDSHPKEDEENV
jgi:uncharacterized protein YoxC